MITVGKRGRSRGKAPPPGNEAWAAKESRADSARLEAGLVDSVGGLLRSETLVLQLVYES